MYETTELQSRTYKIRTPVSQHAVYFTVVGGDKPDGMFINSKELESFQWITALMTSYTRQIRSGVPIESVIDDMNNTFDPKGSYIVPDGTGRSANSLVHHLGMVLARHVEDMRNEG